MISFEGIAEFIAVAETQGFSTAGRRLGVSTSHVSRRVAALESSLGTALFARTTRQVRLTEAGHQYYQRCTELMHGLEEANERVSSEQVQLSGTLRVSAAGEFAEKYVAPALLEFVSAHPALSLEMDFNSRMVNFVEEGIDFSIRYGRLHDSGLVARKLAHRSLIAAASPEYLANYGEPQHPSELAQHNCLIANSDVWLFDTDKGPLEIKVKGKLKTNSARSLILACQSGLGITYMPKSSLGSALSDGSLQPILTSFGTKDLTTWVVYANRKYLPSRARLAINHLLNHFKDWREE
ncbi:LysR family transcriptional regulator [Litoribacillus peritrichatus]|uniref:LysR substrate-binding domain-containing protein n=1 Tax=Litoribacillus peritrichatus TaxID=718191 RepID=A0ABP7N2S6_9GAMM